MGHSNKTNIHHALSCARSCVPTIPHGDPMRSICYFLHFTDEKVRHREIKELAPSYTAGRWWGHDLTPQPTRVTITPACQIGWLGWTTSGAVRSAEAELEQERGLQLSVGSRVLGRWEWAVREGKAAMALGPLERLSTHAQKGSRWYSLTGPRAEFPPVGRAHPCSKNELQVF